MKLQKDANLASPVNRVQLSGSGDVDWTPYPRSNQITYHSKPAQLPRLRAGLADITTIMVQVQVLFYDETLFRSFRSPLEQAAEPYNCLQKWLEDWPDGSQAEKEPIPHFLILR